MDRKKGVPIQNPAESGRIEDCGLPNYGALVGCFHFELKPRAARHFHLRHQVQPTARFDTLDAPEIQSIPCYKCLWIAAAPAQSHSAYKEIEEASNLP